MGTLGTVIALSNGERIEFLTGSGALGFDGRGWWWEYPLRWAGLLNPHEFTMGVKTLTLRPRVGNLRWSAPWQPNRLVRAWRTRQGAHAEQTPVGR